MQCSSARFMAKSPESSKAGRAVRARGRRARTTPFAHLTEPSIRARGRRHRGPRVRFRVVQAVRARGQRAHIHRSNIRLPRASHSSLEHPTPAVSHSSLEHHDPPRALIRRSSTSALVGITSGARPPEGHRKRKRGRGVPQRPHSCFLKNSYTSMPQGRAGRGIRLCDPAPAPHPPSRARQLHATRCARRAE